MKGPGFWKHGGAWGGGSFYKHHTGSGRGPAAPNVDCPESGCEVCFSDCLRCENFQQWDERDELRRCYHKYMDLESRGYYDGTWDDHPENFDPETFERIQERKQRNEDFEREMELERKDEEFERRAEEIERKADAEYEEYLKDKYGEYEDERDHEEEEREKDEDEDDYEEEDDEDEDEYGEDDYFDDDQDDGYDYGDGWRG